MWHSGKNPLHKVSREGEDVYIPKSLPQRRLHKAFLRYHDANNWPLLREALRRMGRADLIGSGKRHLVPAWQPKGTGPAEGARKPGHSSGRILTQHTGLPPRDDGAGDGERQGRGKRPGPARTRGGRTAPGRQGPARQR
jgi:hypothetical protein